MSYDIFVFTKSLDDQIKEEWLDKLKSFGITSKLHPNFSFFNQSGFLSFCVQFDSNIIPKYNGRVLLSGFELYIDNYSVSDYELEDCDEETVNVLKRAKHQLTINISGQDSLEFRLGFLSSAIMTELLDGVVFNPQEGVYYPKATMYNDILKEIKNDDEYLNKNGWTLHEFKGWK